jgi:hypothetical protein
VDKGRAFIDRMVFREMKAVEFTDLKGGTTSDEASR